MAVQMTRSNEIQGSAAARLLDMLLPRPSSTFLMRGAGTPPSILVVDRSLPPSEGVRAVVSTRKGLRLATLEPDFNPSSVWGVVTWIIRAPF
ncbi:MAG: molybdenum ABC transporter permease [Aminobacteriaceae bacterium]